jgi:cyclase
MLTRRVIVCLDVKGGRVVKGIGFEKLRDVGEPAKLASQYEAEGADEIVFLDISASAEERATHLAALRDTAELLYVPLTVGGGVRSADDVGLALRAGADKVSVNSAAVARPELLTEAAERFGSQCVVASIDARRENRGWGNRWRVYTHGGRMLTGLEATTWAQECVERGAGEILLTSIDRDGSRDGYDIELIQAVSECVTVPVVASGGAGSARDVVEAMAAGADAALVAGIVHDRVTTVASIKQAMREAAVPVRDAAAAAA